MHMHVYMCMHRCTYTCTHLQSRINKRPAWDDFPRTFCPAHLDLSRDNSRPAWEILPAHFAPHTLPCSCWCGWISPTQAPPFERHPRPAGDEGNETAKVAPSGLGQCQVVEPESAHTRPGSLARTTHMARGCSRGPKCGGS